MAKIDDCISAFEGLRGDVEKVKERVDSLGKRRADADPTYEEGDRVKVTYGQYSGKTGTIVESSPSGKFYIVKVGKSEISLHFSDFRKVGR